MRGPVLFVSHDATRTGAPDRAAHAPEALSRARGTGVEVLLRQDGELIEQFRSLARVTHWPCPSDPPLARGTILRDLWKRSPDSQKSLVTGFATRHVSLLYSNTITNGDVLLALKPLHVPVITHVHELEHWMLHRLSRRQLGAALAHTDVFIAASDAVADCVMALGASPERVVTVRECIEIGVQPSPEARQTARAEWGVPDNAFVVGTCGTMDWRKGVDLLAPLAREVERQSPLSPVHWIWVGGEQNGSRAGKLRHDFKRCDSSSAFS